MQHQVLQQPIHVRCDEISKWIDECTNKDLAYVLPDIIEDIFGITNRNGWGLMNIEYTSNPQEFDLIFKFLHPNGPIFRLCYKLLSDPYIKYNFHLSLLPQKVRQSIEEGTALSFYMEKLEVDPRTRTPLSLALNPFELYMFHFMYHVVNPCLKTEPYKESKVYSSLYLRLAEEYLSVFLPCDGSTVQPELPSHYISQSPHRSIPQNRPVRTPTVFRQDVLMKILKQSPQVNTLQTSSHDGIWRSELTVQLCIDFWLNTPNTTNSPSLWSEYQLPSCEHLHAVRLLVKHLHYFANSLIEDSSAMDELKKVIIPSSQRKVYHFIRQTMQHWPFDSSFKQILEIWLSYIQPWRYFDYKTRYNRPKGEPMPDSSRWLTFIAENLLVYSVIFYQLIDRFKMVDLKSCRNAYMLYRLTKVFSQPKLSEMIKEVEGNMEEMERRGYTRWMQSHLLELEGPAFQYKSIFARDSNIEDFVRMVKEAEIVATSRLEEELRKKEQMSFWQRLLDMGRSCDEYTLSEQKNVPVFLEASIKNLMTMFQIPEHVLNNVSRPSPNNTPGYTPGPACINKTTPKQMVGNLDDVKYEGNPDLQPIRSYEIACLVRFLYYLCSYFNYNYSAQINSLYMRRDIIGGVMRQVLSGPQVYYYYDTRVPLFPVRVRSSLPPRLSLRILANNYLLGYTALFYVGFVWLSGLSYNSASLVLLLCWFLFIVLRWLLGYAPVPSENRPDLYALDESQ